MAAMHFKDFFSSISIHSLCREMDSRYSGSVALCESMKKGKNGIEQGIKNTDIVNYYL